MAYKSPEVLLGQDGLLKEITKTLAEKTFDWVSPGPHGIRATPTKKGKQKMA